MGKTLVSRNFFSPIVHFSTVVWTLLCIVGTWFVILKYGILLNGLIAVALTFVFAALIWAGPFLVLLILSLYVEPADARGPVTSFQELIRRGLKETASSLEEDF